MYVYILTIGSAMVFSQEDITVATNNFAENKVVGQGGFGTVYHGFLRYTDIAVKVLTKV